MDVSPGPVDVSVLYEQDRHVSSAVWDGQERGALRCHEHTSKLGEWRLTSKQIELVETAGFGYLRKIPAINLDNPLISALVERWRKETNTFHFTVGEMTVTLRDVALLLGLSIDGNPVIGITHTSCALVCERLLGKAPESKYASGGMVKLSWLKEFFSQCPEDSSDEEGEQCTRAYLLYLVGSTIFSTTTGNKVPVMYLPLFENFKECGNYAWGAAALAFLYRALGNACVKSQSTVCGCLTLLQVINSLPSLSYLNILCWCHFHLNIGRLELDWGPIHDIFPFVLWWKGKQSGSTTNRDVVFYRKALDALKSSDVEWIALNYMDSTEIPETIRGTLILGRSKTMLICFDKAERHLPDRCLRQYGMFQPIPEDVLRWVRKSRGVDDGVDLSGKMEPELNEWASRYIHIVEGSEAADETAYMEWYLRITRKVIGRPIPLSTEFQRTIDRIREIAYLADSFSTEGLDGQQFESISRIRYIAQDCLRKQSGSPAIAVPTDTQQVQHGKRIRGKESVRRNSGKRRSKDELVEGQEGSEDDASHFSAGVVEVDPLHAIYTDAEDVSLQMCEVASDMDVDAQFLSRLSDDQDENTKLYDMVDDRKHVDRTIDSTVSQTCEASIKANSSSHVATTEVKSSEVCDRTRKEAYDSETDDQTKKNGSKLFMGKVDKPFDSQILEEATEMVNLTNKPHDTSKVSSNMQISDAAGMASGSEPDNAIKMAGSVLSELQNPSDAASDSQLPDAIEVARDLQPCGRIGDGNNVKIEVNQLQVFDINKDLHISDESKTKNGNCEEEESLQPHLSEENKERLSAKSHSLAGLGIGSSSSVFHSTTMAALHGKWLKLEQQGKGPGARSSHAVTLVGGKAYAFGGEFAPRVPVDNNIYAFDLKTLTWSSPESTGDVPPPRVGVTMAAVGTTIYVFGGRDTEHNELNELYSFDTVTNQWTLLSSGDAGPPHRSYHSTASDDRHVYVFGGCGVAGRLNDLWAYDVVDKKWVGYPSPGDSCKGRGGPGLAVAQGKIWVVYGFAGMEVDDVHCYDPAQKKWAQVETKGEKPTARSVFSTLGIGKYIVISGGEVDPSDLGHMGAGKFTGEAYALDTETLSWKRLDDGVSSESHPGPRGWCAYAAGELEGQKGLLVYGGNSPSNDRLGDMFFFTPSLEAIGE
ncbi:Protein MAIN-LIKE 2 [Linum perenne]